MFGVKMHRASADATVETTATQTITASRTVDHNNNRLLRDLWENEHGVGFSIVGTVFALITAACAYDAAVTLASPMYQSWPGVAVAAFPVGLTILFGLVAAISFIDPDTWGPGGPSTAEGVHSTTSSRHGGDGWDNRSPTGNLAGRLDAQRQETVSWLRDRQR